MDDLDLSRLMMTEIIEINSKPKIKIRYYLHSLEGYKKVEAHNQVDLKSFVAQPRYKLRFLYFICLTPSYPGYNIVSTFCLSGTTWWWWWCLCDNWFFPLRFLIDVINVIIFTTGRVVLFLPTLIIFIHLRLNKIKYLKANRISLIPLFWISLVPFVVPCRPDVQQFGDVVQ